MKTVSLKKYIGFYIFIFFLVQSTNVKAKDPCCQKLILSYVEFDIMTPTNISCSEFEVAFGASYKKKQITDRKQIDKFIRLLNGLKKNNSINNLNVRVKVELFYKDYNEEICIDKFYVLLNGQIYTMNKKFLNFIEDLKQNDYNFTCFIK